MLRPVIAGKSQFLVEKLYYYVTQIKKRRQGQGVEFLTYGFDYE